MRTKIIILCLYLSLMLVLGLAFVLSAKMEGDPGTKFNRMYYVAVVARILSFSMLLYVFASYFFNKRSANDRLYFFLTGIAVCTVLYFLFW